MIPFIHSFIHPPTRSFGSCFVGTCPCQVLCQKQVPCFKGLRIVAGKGSRSTSNMQISKTTRGCWR